MARLLNIAALLAVLVCTQAYNVKLPFGPKTYHGVRLIKVRDISDIAANDANPECTAIYEVTLSEEWTTQCNDLGMLPPHGVDQTPCLDVVGNFGQSKNWTNWPYPTNSLKQNVAKAMSSVTALTETQYSFTPSTFNQPNKDSSAFPTGHNMDTLKESHSVCVTIKNVGQRWIEIMAQTTQQDRSICVTDWKKPALADNPVQEACGSGEIYSCRPANNLRGSTDVNLRFFCKDSCEANDMDFYWRVTASYMTNSNTGNVNANNVVDMNGEGDGEDWCMMRKGDDYPMSLLNPYPSQYTAPNVFFGSTSAAISSHPSFPLLVLLVALAFVLLFAF